MFRQTKQGETKSLTKEDKFNNFIGRTTFDRPNISKIFEHKAKKYAGKTVGVFFCGPPVVARELLSNCEEFTDVKTNTKFKFHKDFNEVVDS